MPFSDTFIGAINLELEVISWNLQLVICAEQEDKTNVGRD